MIKLIACDLDETLLNSDKKISEKNRIAIQRAKDEYGVLFVPATGRGYTCIDAVLDPLALRDQEDAYIISNNGGILCTAKDYQKLQFHALPFALACELFQFGYEANVCIQVFTDKDVYAFHLNEDEKKWLFMFKPDSIICEETSLAFLKDTPIAKILFQNTDMTYLQQIAKQMKPITKDKVSVSYSSNRYLELNAIGVDKGLGLRELAAHLGIAIEDTMAIGDNLNDYAMLKDAGVAVAVANAVAEIQAISDYVTKANCNEDAVAEAIQKFIFAS